LWKPYKNIQKATKDPLPGTERYLEGVSCVSYRDYASKTPTGVKNREI
jgi:hypothetical protein